MSHDSWLISLKRTKAIAVIRTDHLETGRLMAKAVATGGMPLIEVTWNSDRPTHLIEKLQQDLPHCTIGAGTLLTPGDVKAAIAAGAEFLFSPHTNPALIEIAVAQGVPMVAGALSPTEIVTAWQAGSTCVKVFPIQSVGGSRYIRSLKEPLGTIPLIPTGGVTIENAREFLEAGAIAVGLAGQLFPKAAIARGNWETITQQAKTLMQNLSNSYK